MKNDEAMDRLLERVARPAGDLNREGCLDADLLAAWSEGSLTAAERAVAEVHVADCDRCLAMLAAMARTAPPAETPSESWFSLRWMLPLGAAAAVVLAVVLVQDPRDVPLPAPMPSPAPSIAPQPAPAAVPERDQLSQAAPAPPERTTRQAPGASGARKEAPKREAEAAAKQIARPENVTIDGLIPAPAAAPAAPVAGAQSARAFRESVAALAEIISPDPAVRWRLAGASVARSTDGGQSWTTRTTGTEAPLLAGTAPSANVCWIVGRSGTVLLTTDAATWQRLEFPDPAADLVGVTARDARAATVTTAAGRTYRTDDGGRTWVLQENVTTPFYQ